MRDLIVPKVGLTVESVEVVEWVCNPGDSLASGEPMVTLNADKTDVVVEADADLVVVELLAQVGDEVTVGGVLARVRDQDEQADQTMDEPSAVGSAEPRSVSQQPDATATTIQASESTEADERTWSPPPSEAAETSGEDVGTQRRRVRSSPYARKLARRLGIDLDELTGTGPDGRVVARDVPQQPTRRGAPPTDTIRRLRARVDAFELLGVESLASAGGAPVDRLSIIVAWSVDALASRIGSWDRGGGTAIVEVIRMSADSGELGIGSIPVVPGHRAVDLAELIGQSLRSSREFDSEPSVAVVDLTTSGLDGDGPFSVRGAPIELVIGGLEDRPRVRNGELVSRPSIALTLCYDSNIMDGAVAGSLLREVADRLAHAGDVVQQIPSLRG